MTKNIITGLMIAAALWTQSTVASTKTNQDWLIKLAPGVSTALFVAGFEGKESAAEVLADQWVRVQLPEKKANQILELQGHPSIEWIQPNYPIHLQETYKIADPLRRAALVRYMKKSGRSSAKPPLLPDNPPIPPAPSIGKTGADPLFSQQWGMQDIGVVDGWKTTKGSPEMVVAVIDTGVDYTHEDLAPNLWRNSKEIPNNGRDDDGNGYVDDVIGWDFVSNDNKPYDLAFDQFQVISGGGNPGHGTHCAGNVAARGDNALGIAGVAPNVKIMSLRFISEKGEGTTAQAIKAIRYAVDNGAKVMSNSWGSEGEDPDANEENKALRDTVQYAEDHGVLFIAAAGNGHQGRGYDNDKDKAPAYPASYEHDIIVSVAALASNDKLGSFSNWGAHSVDIGAPGVAVFSTTVGNKYSDKVVDVGGVEVTWDGTSMAAPHVAGAAALYWSAHPQKTWQEVKAALLGSVKKINSLNMRSVSGGKLDVRALMQF